jgi:hypothetical protein
MMLDVGLPVGHVRAQVASAIDVIAHMARLPNGRRVVLEVATVDGIHDEQPVLTPLFRFRHRLGTHGLFESTGVVPSWRSSSPTGGSDPPGRPLRPSRSWPAPAACRRRDRAARADVIGDNRD